MATATWALDPTHSEINFKVKHLMISSVSGKFTSFEGSVNMDDEDLSTAKVQFSGDINSINTGNEQRDEHLRAADFFDAENFPKFSFGSDFIEKTGDENYLLHGTLTIRGISKDIVLNVEFGGSTIDPWGRNRTGYSLNGKINRKDFGISFSMVSETGGVLLGEEIKISAEVELVKETVAELV